MMATLWLSEPQAREIVDHVRAALPREACGLIAGRNGRADRVIPIANVAADPRRYFLMDHAAQVKAFFEIQRSSLELVAIYHSHPCGEPVPSQTDMEQAAYPDVAYLIVGMRGGEARLAAWKLRRHEAEPSDLYVGTGPPPLQTTQLSNSQKIAIIISAILAFTFMIILSLSLLPPAPQIP